MDQKIIEKEIQKIISAINLKNFNEVIKIAKENIKKYPTLIPFYNYLSIAYRSIYSFELAEKTLLNALTINSKDPSILSNLGSIYRITLNFKKAEECFAKGLKNNPEHVSLLINYANLKRDKIDLDGAIKLYEKALSIKKDNLITLQNLASSYQVNGEFDKAKKTTKYIIENFPKITTADKIFSNMNDYSINKKHQELMIKKLNEIDLNNQEKIPLYFSIAKSFEDQKNYKESFKYFKKGNEYQRKKFLNYSIKEEENKFNKIKEFFNNYEFKNNDSAGENLIFIVGMPRSGTTLVHQIIGTHSKVFGAGELEFFNTTMAQSINNQNFLNDFNDNDKITKIREFFNLKFETLKSKNKIILDKLPLNFLWIGFIKIIYPKSKIIHCVRNLEDICLSNYKNVFEGDVLKWTYNLDELLVFAKLYLDLMRFWHKKMPNNIYDLSYENLIDNQELETNNILKFCNLDWESNCLNFFKTKIPIETVSIFQARQPIYKSSIKKSLKYPELKEFFKKVSDLKKNFN